MDAYLLDDWCGLGPRIVVHSCGLPRGWTTLNVAGEARAQACRFGESGQVVFLDPETFEVKQRIKVKF